MKRRKRTSVTFHFPDREGGGKQYHAHTPAGLLEHVQHFRLEHRVDSLYTHTSTALCGAVGQVCVLRKCARMRVPVA